MAIADCVQHGMPFLAREILTKMAFSPILSNIFQEHIEMLNKALPLSLVLMSGLPTWASSNEDVP